MRRAGGEVKKFSLRGARGRIRTVAAQFGAHRCPVSGRMLACPHPSRPATSRSRSALATSSSTSTSRSTPAIASAWSGPTASASRRCCACSPAGCDPTPARCRWRRRTRLSAISIRSLNAAMRSVLDYVSRRTGVGAAHDELDLATAAMAAGAAGCRRSVQRRPGTMAGVGCCRPRRARRRDVGRARIARPVAAAADGIAVGRRGGACQLGRVDADPLRRAAARRADEQSRPRQPRSAWSDSSTECRVRSRWSATTASSCGEW